MVTLFFAHFIYDTGVASCPDKWILFILMIFVCSLLFSCCKGVVKQSGMVHRGGQCSGWATVSQSESSIGAETNENIREQLSYSINKSPL